MCSSAAVGPPVNPSHAQAMLTLPSYAPPPRPRPYVRAAGEGNFCQEPLQRDVGPEAKGEGDIVVIGVTEVDPLKTGDTERGSHHRDLHLFLNQ